MKKPARYSAAVDTEALDPLLLGEIQQLSGACAMIIGEDGSLLFQTSNLATFLEADEHTLHRNVLIERTHPADRPALRAYIASPTHREITFRLCLPTDRIATVKGRSRRIDAGRPARTLLVMQHVSDRDVPQRGSGHPDRSDALALLAGPLAHDMNNALGIIIGNLSVIDPRRFDPQEDATALDSALKAAERGSRIMQSLERLAVRQPGATVRVNLGAQFRGLLPVFGYLLGDRIEVVDALGTGEHAIDADLATINRVILDVAITARQAMPEGGKLETRLAGPHAGAGHVNLMFACSTTGISPRRPGQTGTRAGDESARERGLAHAVAIMQSLGGNLRVASDAGIGYTVTLEFPVRSAAAAVAPSGKRVIGPRAPG